MTKTKRPRKPRLIRDTRDFDNLVQSGAIILTYSTDQELKNNGKRATSQVL